MTKTRRVLDLIPFIILVASASILLIAVALSEVTLQSRHIIGLVAVAASGILFFVRHKIAVLSVGVINLVGLLGGLSYSPAITTHSFGVGNQTLLTFQPIFLLWLTIFFILSGRYFTGILSSQYWRDIRSDEPFRLNNHK